MEQFAGHLKLIWAEGVGGGGGGSCSPFLVVVAVDDFFKYKSLTYNNCTMFSSSWFRARFRSRQCLNSFLVMDGQNHCAESNLFHDACG